MTHVLVIAILASCLVVGYVFVGYPLMLALIVRVRGERPIARRDITPHVSLIISAYNEAAVIRAKIENALSLDYPDDALDIVVISDASSDGTDDIVRAFAPRVRLARQDARRGKTSGLNRVLPTLRGEIVVFSDANAMYQPDALRKLTRNFADPAVGYVTGEARYLADGGAVADVGERAYWDYEIQIKRLETQVGSMVGGDGAIYAIRRQLWQMLPEDAINDFLNPLQIVAAGWRGVYEPEAICYEETAGAVKAEYRRRVRIVSRSWRAVFLVPGVLNPFRVGLFAWSLVSHKLLRWFTGGALAVAGAATVGLVSHLTDGVLLQIAGLAAAALGVTCIFSSSIRRATAMVGYFAALNVASLQGVAKGSLGRVSGVWATPREGVGGGHHVSHGLQISAGALIAACGVLLAAAALAIFRAMGGADAARFAFWSSVTMLGYVYVGYPVLLTMWARVYRRPVHSAAIEPGVCLFIPANDEEEVIEAKLLNALALDYPQDRLDIVVVSDGSVDTTESIVRRFAPRVRLLPLAPRRGKIAVINDGMRSVASDLVIFSDANTFLERDAVRKLVQNFADPRVGAVSGDVALVGERASMGRSEDLYYCYERWVQQAESHAGSMIGADGALYAIRRELFVAPQSDTILDDMAIPMAVARQGYRVIFEPQARASERGCETANEEFERKSRVVAGAVQFLTRADSAVPVRSYQLLISLFSHKALRWLSPVFAVCALIASAVLANQSAIYALAFVTEAAMLLVGVAGCVRSLRRWSVVATAHYFWLVQIAAAVGVVRGLAGRQSVLWRRFTHVAPARAVRMPQ